MTPQKPGDERPTGLRIAAAVFGFILGVWGALEPVESRYSSCSLVEELTEDCGRGLQSFAPQIVAVVAAFFFLVYAFESRK
jgi:hypothetical protein